MADAVDAFEGAVFTLNTPKVSSSSRLFALAMLCLLQAIGLATRLLRAVRLVPVFHRAVNWCRF